MKITKDVENHKTIIEITDYDLQAATPGTALFLVMNLLQAITIYGNLQIRSDYRYILKDVWVNDHAHQDDDSIPERFLQVG